MRRRQAPMNAGLVSILTAFFATASVAQEPTPKTPECSVRVYKSGEVDRKVKILAKPEPRFSKEEVRRHKNTAIILRAIFCGSGKVTDVRVSQGVSDRLNEEAIDAARRIKFTPAEKNGEKVSQLLIIEYRIVVSP